MAVKETEICRPVYSIVSCMKKMDDENLLTYDIAVSFAGEDRDYVEQIANAIRLKGMSVFYDKYEEADLWGKDLYVHLTKVYKDYSKYCLMFISESYAQKQWTSHERTPM